VLNVYIIRSRHQDGAAQPNTKTVSQIDPENTNITCKLITQSKLTNAF